MVASHQYPFDDVVAVHQKCRAQDYTLFDRACRTVDLPREKFDPLLLRFGVDPTNARAEKLTHGEGAAHWHKAHTVNHLCGLENTDADYIVFSDCDCRIRRQPSSWVVEGIRILQNKPEVLIVSPGDGAQNGGPGEGGQWPDGTRLTRNVSQQLFLCRGDEFRRTVDFDVPWNGKFDAPGGPLQEWYFMLEGRMGRYMGTSGQWRAILPDAWRYWHNSYWASEREEEGWQ